jgi:hypothetical protein
MEAQILVVGLFNYSCCHRIVVWVHALIIVDLLLVVGCLEMYEDLSLSVCSLCTCRGLEVACRVIALRSAQSCKHLIVTTEYYLLHSLLKTLTTLMNYAVWKRQTNVRMGNLENHRYFKHWYEWVEHASTFWLPTHANIAYQQSVDIPVSAALRRYTRYMVCV